MDVRLVASNMNQHRVGRGIEGAQEQRLVLAFHQFAEGDVSLADAQRTRLQRVLLVERGFGGNDVAADFQDSALRRCIGEDQRLFGELSRAPRWVIGYSDGSGISWFDGSLGIVDSGTATTSLSSDDEQSLSAGVHQSHLA